MSPTCHGENKRVCWFVGLCMLVFCCVAKSEAKVNYGVIIPFLKMTSEIPLLAISIAFIVIILIKKGGRFQFDAIASLLLIRCILNIAPILYINVPDSYLGNYISAWLPFMFYFILLNSKIDARKIYKVLIFFGIIISIQCFWTYYLITSRGIASYFDLWYKSFFVIPIGGTNHIACVLIPLLIIGNRTLLGKKRLFYVSLLVAAIVFTKSRGGVVLILFYFFVELFLNAKNRKKKMMLIIAFLPLLAFGMLFFLSGDGLQAIQMFFRGFSSSKGTLNSFSSGRLALFKQFFIYIGNHLFLGNGVSYDQLTVGANGTHNFILTILYENGLAGLTLYSIFAVVVISRIRIYNEPNCNARGFFSKIPAVAMLFIFINSMFEQCLFTLSVDLIFLIMVRVLGTNSDNLTMEK